MSYTIWTDGSIGNNLQDVYRERIRQDDLKKSGKFNWCCFDIGPLASEKLAVLAEEFGEVAREVTEMIITISKYKRENLHYPNARRRERLNKLKKELIQVAAVCVGWCEAIDEELEMYKDNDYSLNDF